MMGYNNVSYLACNNLWAWLDVCEDSFTGCKLRKYMTYQLAFQEIEG